MAAVVIKLSVETLSAEVRRYEERYGLPSERMREAFRGRDSRESAELRRWSRLYRTLEAARRRAM